MTSTVRVEVQKKGNENSTSLIRRFSRKVQSAGIIRTMRNRRFFNRPLSKNVQRKKRLISLKRREKYEDLVKLGKIEPRSRGRRR